MRGLMAVFFLLAAAAGESAASASPKEISIAGIFDSSGAGAAWGASEANSFKLAIEDFEKSNPNIKVRAVIEDSAYSNNEAVKAIQKIISVDKIRFIIGPTWEVFSSIIPVCEIRSAVCLAPSHNSAEFENKTIRYSFSAWFDERGYAWAHLKGLNGAYRRTAVITGSSPYYETIHEELLRGLKERPTFDLKVLPTDMDFRSIIAKMPRDIDSLAVFLVGSGAAQNFFKQWAEIRQDRPAVFTDDAPLYFNPPLDLKKMGFRVFYASPEIASAKLEQYSAGYRRRFGKSPESPSGPIAYDETMLLLGCLKYHDKPAEVRDCVANTKNYSGVSGDITFSGSQSVRDRYMTSREL